MALHNLYSFSRVNRPNAETQRPIRFVEPSQEALHLYSLEVLDTDNNGQFNRNDRYFFNDHVHHQRRELSPALGQQLLHYYCDPQVLRERREYLQVSRQSLEDSNLPRSPERIANFRDLNPLRPERSAIRQPHLFWSNEDNLDLGLLSGARTFTEPEVREYTNLFRSGHTMRRRFTGTFWVDRVGKTTGSFAGIFIAGEKLLHSAFMWEMYTSNFLFAMTPGSIAEGFRLRGQIDRNLNAASHGRLNTHEARLNANLETGESRLRMMEDHLYWIWNTPLLIYGCVGDKSFKTFMRHPLRNFLDNMTKRYTGSQLALAGGIFAKATSLASAFAIYNITSTWFEQLNGMPHGSNWNRFASLTSTLLTESVLLSRTSMEMGAFTTSSAFRRASFGEMGLARFGPRAFFRGAATSLEGGTLLRPLGTTLLAGTALLGLGIGLAYATGAINRETGLGGFVDRASRALENWLD